jgi:hypothetical protein
MYMPGKRVIDDQTTKMGYVRVFVRVMPLHYDANERGYVSGFSIATQSALQYYPIRFHHDIATVSIDAHSLIYTDYRISLWVYAIEQDEQGILFTHRIGACYFPIASTVNNEGKPMNLPLKDEYGIKVGTIRVGLAWISSDVSVMEGIDEKQARLLRDSTALIEKHISRMTKHKKAQFNIKEVGVSDFRDVLTTRGLIPMWSFPYYAWKTATTNVPTLEWLLQVVCFNMGLSIDKNEYDVPTMSELLSELLSLVVRGCYYTPDSSRRERKRKEIIDEWSYLCHQPSLGYASFDCEDGSASIVEFSSMLTNMTTTTIPLLRNIQRHDRLYVTVFCIGTLRLPNTETYVYHVFVMKLDRTWFMQRLSSSSAAVSISSKYLPAILIDSTNYSSGCWEYRSSTMCTEAIYERTRRMKPVEVSGKIPSELQFSRRSMYGHTQTIVCPELIIGKHGVCQIDLFINSKVGVPTKELMNYNNTISFECLTVTQSEIQAVDECYRQLMPPIIHPSVPYGASIIHLHAQEKKEKGSSRLRMDGVVRYVDYNEEMIQEYARKKRISDKEIDKYVIHLVDGLKVVRIRSSST